MENELDPVPRQVEYFHSTDQTIRSLVRVLAIWGVVVGAAGIALNALALYLPEYRRSPAWSSSFAVWFAGSVVIVFATTLLLLVGSIMALRPHPRGRRVLLVYAYAHFAYVLFAIVLNSWWTLTYYRGFRAPGSGVILTSIGSVFIRSVSGIGLAIVFAVLLPRPEFRRIFHDE